MLTAVLDSAPRTSRALVVEGPAGVGRSSLLGAAVEHAAVSGCTVRQARPTEAESSLDFAMLVDLLRGIDLGRLAESQRAALEVALGRRQAAGTPPTIAALGGALVELLDGRGDHYPDGRDGGGERNVPPLVWVIDDLQWADQGSLALIEFVGRRLPAAGVVLLAAWHSDDDAPTVRPDSQRAQTPATNADDHGLVLPDTTRLLTARTRGDGSPATVLPEATRLHLGPLDDDSIEQLVRAQLPNAAPESRVAPIVAAAGGNPRFAVELARDAEQATPRPGEPLVLPAPLHAEFANRLRPLPDSTIEALAAVALLASPTVAGLSELGLLDALHDAEVAGIVRFDGRRIAFSHPLLASAANAAVSATRRLGLHRRLAAITDGIERSVHRALGATHPEPAVATALTTAADDLIANGEPAGAADMALLAVDVTAPDDELRWARLALAADALFRSGRTDEAIGHLRAVCAGAADSTVRCRALLALATIEYERSDDSETAARLAREVLTSTADAELLAEAHTILAFVIYTDFAEAARHADAALELIERNPDPDPRRLADAITAAANARFHAGEGFDRAGYERAIELQRGLPIPAADSAFGSLAAQLKYADELDEARTMLETLARDADPGSLPYALGHLPQLHLWAGDWDAAHECARRHLELAEQTGQAAQEQLARFNLAFVAAFHGDVGAAAEIGARLAADGRDQGVPWTERNGLGLLGFVAMSSNDPTRAVELFSRYDELGEGMHLIEPGYGRFHGDYIEALVATGDLARAAEVVERVDARSQRVGRASGIATAQRGRALLAATGGERDAAYDHAQQAVATLAQTPLAYERARALLTEGLVARRFKDRSTARRALEEALDEFERIGALSLAERTRHELARIPGRVVGDGRTQQLTATEQRVAVRAAAGDTTRQIADALFISVKTVEANLTRIYRKLGVSNRAQLASLLATAPSEPIGRSDATTE